MQQVCITEIDTARILCVWPRRKRHPKAPPIRHACLFPPVVMRRQRTRREFRYVKLATPREMAQAITAIVAAHRPVALPAYWQEGKRREAVARGYDDLDAPYLMDWRARDFVAAHPDGASLFQVAEALAIGKSTAEDIEKRAFRKLLERAQVGDLPVRRWLSTLGSRAGLVSIEEAYDDDDC